MDDTGIGEPSSSSSSSSSTTSGEWGEPGPEHPTYRVQFTSIASRTLLRFIVTLKASTQKSSCEEIFHFIRYDTRFSAYMNNEFDDTEAIHAESEADKKLVQIVELCFRDIGFAVLRTLAAIREFGNPIVRHMGLLAILRSNALLQSFISLVYLIYLDLSIYSGHHISTLNSQRTAIQGQREVLDFFASPRAMVFNYDKMLQQSDYCCVHVMNKAYVRLEVIEEEQSIAKIEWHPLLTYTRLAHQAAKSSYDIIMKLDDAYIQYGSSSSSSSSSAITVNSGVADICLGVQALLANQETIESEDHVNLWPVIFEMCADKGYKLYSATYHILTRLDQEFEVINQEMFIIQNALEKGNLIVRMKLIEVVSLQMCVLRAVSKRSDDRVAVMKRISDLMVSDLRYLKSNIH